MKETRQEEQARLLTVPSKYAGLMKYSFSLIEKLKIVQSHLQTLFGERANWVKNIQNYYHSQQYISQCNCINGIEDIPIISDKELENWISEEETYSRNVSRIKDLINSINQNEKDHKDAVYEAAGILGVYRSEKNSLFSRIVDYSNCSEEEYSNIARIIRENYNLFEMAVITLSRFFLKNNWSHILLLVQSGHRGKQGIIIVEKTRFMVHQGQAHLEMMVQMNRTG